MSDDTPLHEAAKNGQVEWIMPLLSSGAEVNKKNDHGSTPLHYAAWTGQNECIAVLLDNGAEVGTQNRRGHSPLHDAALYGHVECVRTLLANGAIVTTKNAEGHTALQIAVDRGHTDCADAIRSHSSRRAGDNQQGRGQQPDQNSSGSLQTENEELRTQLASLRSRNHEYEEQLATARAKNDEYEVHMACVMGQGDVLASQDLGVLEGLLAKVNMDCLMKAVVEKRVQWELNMSRDAVSECGVCLSAPKDTSLDPCGHTFCRTCTDRLQVCPICRQTITERRQVFL
eukprot:gene18408-biopygen27339